MILKYFPQFFDDMVFGTELKRGKPYPDIFLKAAELLGCDPKECLAVEDSGNGLTAAKRAGMPCLVIPNQITRYCEFEGYYQLAESLEEVNLDDIIKDYGRF